MQRHLLQKMVIVMYRSINMRRDDDYDLIDNRDCLHTNTTTKALRDIFK